MSWRPRARTAFEQPTVWVLMAAITPARAFVPYDALPVRANTRAAARVRK